MKSKLIFTFISVQVFMLFLISLAFAQSTDSAQSEIIIPKVEEHDFEGVEIDGVIYKPRGFVVRERTPAEFNPLIDLRTDFAIELKQSVAHIQ